MNVQQLNISLNTTQLKNSTKSMYYNLSFEYAFCFLSGITIYWH